MKTGFNLLLWTTHVTEQHLPILDEIAAAGYDGVEIPIFEGAPEHYLWLARELKQRKLEATVVGVVGSEAANPISPDAAIRKAGQAHLDWLVDCSAALGADVLCGPFYAPLGVFTGQGATADEWKRCVESHQAMAARATPHGLTIAVEPLNRFECYFLNTADDAARLVREVGAKNYGYLYDTFHFNIEEKNPVDAAVRTINEIVHVHISDNDRGAPGDGHVPFRKTLKALNDGGYDGWLTVEAFGQALPALAAATKVWRPFFPSESHVVKKAIKTIRKHWSA
ncbi:MAG: sugar phosphate isomerase/epimerase [Rhizobiaceae bacterium]|nr:sugar phosphate isomerase/epimerase [Rhizobiaceae bacterium]